MSLGQHVKIQSSGVIDAPLEKVWNLLRDFNNVYRWHPDVTESRIESGSGREPGAVRAIRLRNGMSVRERLVIISPDGHFYKYSVIASPLPMRAHESIVRLTPRNASQTEVTWTAQFEVTEGDPKSLADGVRAGVLEAGIDGLRRAVAGDVGSSQ
jgi:NADPH:quinone reductase